MNIPDRDTMAYYLKAGLFGNTVDSWLTKQELLESGFFGNVYIRYRGYNASQKQGLFIKDLPVVFVEEAINKAVKDGYFEQNMYFGEWVPVEWLEYCCTLNRSENYLDLRFSDVKKPMRESLAERSFYRFGSLAVDWLLEHAPDDYHHILWLANEFPDCTIEFSIYPRNRVVGTLGRNVLFWGVGNF